MSPNDRSAGASVLAIRPYVVLVGAILIAFAASCSKSQTNAPQGAGMSASAVPDGSQCRPSARNPVVRPKDASAHPSMAWVPGGEFSMGSDDPKFDDARPWHRVRVSGYWIDKTAVTNTEFARFVRATGYVTVAERKPLARDFPNAASEDLVPGSLVFTPPQHPVELNDESQWWVFVRGANWRHPQGPRSGIRGLEHYPVVQIAYEDALTYANWAGKRLPTEAEYEYAERGGLDCKPFAWGDQFTERGKFMANTFQGHFPDKNTSRDRYNGTSPVGSFPANGYGLYDMSGDVWEWTSDWYRADYYRTLADAGQVAIDPKGPTDSGDPKELGVEKRVTRGGSFLCTDQFCSRYEVGGRGETEPSSAANHIGFRLVQ